MKMKTDTAKRPRLVKALKKRQAALTDVREASKLPAWYETGKLYHGTRVNVVVPSLILLMDLANFLAGDARVKAAAGDVAGALEDLTAIKRIKSGGFSHSNLITVLGREGRVLHRQEGIGASPQSTLEAIERIID